MGRAIAEFYAVSVLVASPEAERVVTGRLVCHSLEEALASLSFLLGAKYRKAGESIYCVGGKSDKAISIFPSYGLQQGELSQALHQDGALLGDRIFLEADEMRSAQVRTALEALKDRRSLVLELYVLDVAETQVDRVNAWLNSFTVGAGYYAKTYLGMASAAASAANLAGNGVEMRTVKGPQYNTDISFLLGLMDDGGSIRLEMREQVQVMSGSEVEFTSGEVVEDVTYTTVPNATSGAGQLVSQINRRTVGLVLQLTAAAVNDQWHMKLRMEDSTLMTGTERRTQWRGERVIREQDPYTLLGSFTRKTKSVSRQGVPILKSLPLVKPLFSTGQTNLVNRQLMILARPVVTGP